MKKLLILLYFAVLLPLSCSEFYDNDTDKFHQKISDWQYRERMCDNVNLNFSALESAVNWVSSNKKSVSEKGDYWQSSCETLSNAQEGDCEDTTIFLWRVLEENFLAADQNRIAILWNRYLEAYHATNIIYANSKCYIIDASRISPQKIFDANIYLDKFSMDLIIEFNLESVWRY